MVLEWVGINYGYLEWQYLGNGIFETQFSSSSVPHRLSSLGRRRSDPSTQRALRQGSEQRCVTTKTKIMVVVLATAGVQLLSWEARTSLWAMRGVWGVCGKMGGMQNGGSSSGMKFHGFARPTGGLGILVARYNGPRTKSCVKEHRASGATLLYPSEPIRWKKNEFKRPWIREMNEMTLTPLFLDESALTFHEVGNGWENRDTIQWCTNAQAQGAPFPCFPVPVYVCARLLLSSDELVYIVIVLTCMRVTRDEAA